MTADPPIQRGVPIPPPISGGGKRYNWHEMQVGDMKFFENTNYATTKGTAHRAAKRLGFKFTVRKMKGGVGVWRVS